MLFIVATPIGNLEDITLRALRILKEVDLILAEDTRKTGMLLAHYSIKKPLSSFYEHSEVEKIPWVITQLKQGKNIALVSSAGMPTISDPGYKLIRECRHQALSVSALPGASSVITALASSSLPRENFAFLGYLPRKKGERARLFEKFREFKMPCIFFESPFRIINSLEALREALGNRNVTVARELTKKFEEVLEANISEVLEHFRKHPPKGEFVIIVGKEIEK
ncbi:MAG: 16S rRNA (cytidine(1402)-2'-O)-methyltransferase [Candidatus Omnitrophica bacterium]|nr:16S rRNA (cytidine(1402)-2'-O)-methyltransferase [Candidatus Omnitrophota bacterium]